MNLHTANNVPLFVRQQGHGPVLLLVHGFPLDHRMWLGQLEGLSRSYRVIAPDLRGFGKSGVTEGTVTMSDMADDLAALLDEMDIRLPICLCGLSMGGYIAWQFWSRYPDRLSRLILCDTRAVADSVEVARGRLLMAQSVEATGAEPVAESMIPKLFAASTLREQANLVAEIRNVILSTNPAGIAAAQRGMAQRPDMTERLSQVDLPTLAICGEHDAISGPDEMRGLAQSMPRLQVRADPPSRSHGPLGATQCGERRDPSILGSVFVVRVVRKATGS